MVMSSVFRPAGVPPTPIASELKQKIVAPGAGDVSDLKIEDLLENKKVEFASHQPAQSAK